MLNNDNFNKLQHQLCELKLEERRVCSDISRLVKKNQTIDFYVEAKIMPNIIA